MKTGVKCFLSFVAGMGVGIGACVLYKKIKEQKAMADEDISDEEFPREIVTIDPAKLERLKKDAEDAMDEYTDQEDPNVVLGERVKSDIPDQPVQKLRWADKTEADKANARKQKFFKPPYIIEEVNMGEDGYRMEACVLYADNILTDSEDHIMDIASTIGPYARNVLGQPLEEGGTIDCICVRNEKLETDFEVTLDVRTFVDYCMAHPSACPREDETLEAITDPEGSAKRTAEEYEEFRSQQNY